LESARKICEGKEMRRTKFARKQVETFLVASERRNDVLTKQTMTLRALT